VSARSVLQLVVLGSALFAFIGCDKTTEKEPGAERVQMLHDTVATDVVSRVTGYLLWSRKGWDIVAFSLPSMQQTIVRKAPAEDVGFYATIHALSGPDSEGRIAYIEDHFFVEDEKDRKHLLKTIKVNGTADTEIFSRSGDAMWAMRGEIGHYLALAPSGGMVAFLSGLSNKQMPRALLQEGQLEIWDIEKKRRHNVTAKGIDAPMSWYPDGKRIAYVKLVPRDELPKPALGLENFGSYYGESWNEVPAVYILDIESGKSRFAHVGWVPVVSLDGKTMLVGGYGAQFTWNHFDLESRESAPVKWPGDTGHVVAVAADNVVIYRGLPAEIHLETIENIDQAPTLMVNAAVIDSDESKTVASGIGWFDLLSFGGVLKKREDVQ
jgi:hypothetical protein